MRNPFTICGIWQMVRPEWFYDFIKTNPAIFPPMLLTKPRFFLLVSTLVLLPAPVYRLVWILRAQATTGKAAFEGKTLNGQFSNSYTVVRFYTASGDTVFVNGPDEIQYKMGESIPLLFPNNQPSQARIRSFTGLWLDTVLYSIFPFLLLLIIYLHPAIFPRGTTFLLGKKPLLKVEFPAGNNNAFLHP